MCGRYLFSTDEIDPEMGAILAEIETKFGEDAVKKGEIFPTNRAAILTASSGARPMVWGYPRFQCGGVVINARRETAAEKKMFRSSLETGRCVIPSMGFYEWSQDKAKQKYLFRQPGRTCLYMAGLCRTIDGIERFVILTGEANASVSEIHHRMPLVLDGRKKDDWLHDPAAAEALLSSELPTLVKQPSGQVQERFLI